MDSPPQQHDDLERMLAAAVELHQAGNFPQAEAAYRETIRRYPSDVRGINLLAKLASDANQNDLALQLLLRAIEISPGDMHSHHNLASMFIHFGRTDDAMASLQRAISIAPDFLESWKTISILSAATGKFDEALVAAEKCCSLKPGDAPLLTNLAIVLSHLGRDEEAVAACERAIAAQPDFADAHWQLGTLLLRSGDFEKGWPEFEWRLKSTSLATKVRKFKQPAWQSSEDTGRTIFLYAEQNFGDTIQFIRYAPIVAANQGHVIVEVQPELAPLIRNTMPEVEVIDAGSKVPLFDVHASLLSLPGILQTTLESIPAETPYLHANAETVAEWRNRVGEEFNVGVAWSGRPTNRDDKLRSIPFEVFAKILVKKGVRFHSLQKELPTQDVIGRKKFSLVDHSKLLNDFAETAALVESLDLIITVDTAVAHLAGAMSMPVWLLLPFTADWRWLKKRPDSPWYRTMQIFRQSKPGDWQGVLDRVNKKLLKLIKDR